MSKTTQIIKIVLKVTGKDNYVRRSLDILFCCGISAVVIKLHPLISLLLVIVDVVE